MADAILTCRGSIETSRLLNAAREAHEEGLLTTRELRLVRKELKP